MAKEAGALAPHHSTSQTHLQAAELEAQLHAKDQEILQLFEANQKLQGELAELRSHLSQQVAIHEGQLADKRGEVERLRQELAAQQDYAEVKRELRLALWGLRSLVCVLLWQQLLMCHDNIHCSYVTCVVYGIIGPPCFPSCWTN